MVQNLKDEIDSNRDDRQSKCIVEQTESVQRRLAHGKQAGNGPSRCHT